METIIRTGDVMEIKPASVFEMTRLGSAILPKANRISLIDIQKFLKKIYISYWITATKSISKESTKFVAGTQGINIGEFSGPKSFLAPANADIHTCIAKNHILKHMILRFHIVPIDKKNKKFKGTFRDASVDLNAEPQKKIGDEYLPIESKEMGLLEKEHPYLFALVFKKMPESSKQIELAVYSCVCELQAKDIVKALEGELLNKGQALGDEASEVFVDNAEQPIISNNPVSNDFNNFENLQNMQPIYQQENSLQMSGNNYNLNNLSLPNAAQNGNFPMQPQFNNNNQPNPYMLQQPVYQSVPQTQPQLIYQMPPQQIPQQQASSQSEYSIYNQPMNSVVQPNQQMALQINPQQQLAKPIQENLYDDINRNIQNRQVAPSKQSQPNPVDQSKQKPQLQPSNSFYGKNYYIKNTQLQPVQTSLPSDDQFVNASSAAHMRENFASKEQSLSIGQDQVFSPPTPVTNVQTPLSQNVQNPISSNSANNQNAFTPVFSPPAQNPYLMSQQNPYQLSQQNLNQMQAPAPQQFQYPQHQQNDQIQSPQQPHVQNPMNPSGMIMGAPRNSHYMSSNSDSVSTPSTGEADDPYNIEPKPVALVKPRKILGVAVLPFPAGGMSPQPMLNTYKSSESDPEKKIIKNLPPPVKSKPPTALQKPTLIDKTQESSTLDNSENQYQEVPVQNYDIIPTMPNLIRTDAPFQRELEENIQVETNNAIQEGLGYLP